MIKIKKLFKTFINSNHQSTRVFDNFNLEILPKELIVIFGPSGCGKSTLINLITGTECYDSGSIEGIQETERMGFVSQHSSLLPWLKVIDNIAFGLKLQGMDKISRRKEAYKLLEEMGLTSYSDFYPYQLSGGLLQLISFARSVAYKAEIMLMDEPFSSLDFFIRNKLQDIILKIHKKRGLTTIFVTHQVDEALYLGDRIVALSADKPTRILTELDTRGINNKSSEYFYKIQRELLSYYQ
jgi:NitT/TauT family transport system ATP-binding protein